MLTRTHHTGNRRGGPGPTKVLRTIAVGVISIAVLASCGSDEDGSSTTERADDAPAATSEATEADTTAPVTEPPATEPSVTDPPITEPPITEPPATEPPVTTIAAIEYPIVVEGTTTEPENQMGSRGEGPNGRKKYYNLKVFDGGLVGEGNAVGWWRIGESSVEGAEVVDFTGELVGVGSGTFTYADQFGTTFDGQFTATAEIVGTGGAFEDLIGTIEYSSSDFGATRTFRATFTPAPTDDGAVLAPALTTETASAIADEVAIAFTNRDFERVARRLGPDGTWIAIGGAVYDQSSIADFLGTFDFITDIVRTGQRLEGPDGFAFEMSETLSGGEQMTFWLAVSRDETGTVTITEYPEAPNW